MDPLDSRSTDMKCRRGNNNRISLLRGGVGEVSGVGLVGELRSHMLKKINYSYT